MSPFSISVLQGLALAGRWCAPMRLGGTNNSHHSLTLKRLSEKGLVERRDTGRGRYLYRITPEGLTALPTSPILPQKEPISQ